MPKIKKETKENTSLKTKAEKAVAAKGKTAGKKPPVKLKPVVDKIWSF